MLTAGGMGHDMRHKQAPHSGGPHLCAEGIVHVLNIAKANRLQKIRYRLSGLHVSGLSIHQKAEHDRKDTKFEVQGCIQYASFSCESFGSLTILTHSLGAAGCTSAGRLRRRRSARRRRRPPTRLTLPPAAPSSARPSTTAHAWAGATCRACLSAITSTASGAHLA